ALLCSRQKIDQLLHDRRVTVDKRSVYLRGRVLSQKPLSPLLESLDDAFMVDNGPCLLQRHPHERSFLNETFRDAPFVLGYVGENLLEPRFFLLDAFFFLLRRVKPAEFNVHKIPSRNKPIPGSLE